MYMRVLFVNNILIPLTFDCKAFTIEIGAKAPLLNHHALYVLGYTRTTMAVTEGSKLVIASETQKAVTVRIEG